ncbi:MAG: AAA family ATPase [Selenomonas ruminantium]|nr:AAA family ATPase [Selenomonas ruminantium]
MALPINIEDLLHQRKVERTRIEYKSEWNPEPIIHTLTAYANDFDNMGGGYILIGVEEKNGRPVLPLKGLAPECIDEIQLDLLNKCNFIEPRYIPVIEPCVIDGRHIIVLWAPGGEERPYRCPEKIYTDKGGEKSNKSYYIRKGARTIKANHNEEKELISAARDIPFDDRINYHAEVADLKPTLLADYLHSVGSSLYQSVMERPVEEVGTDMQIVRGPSEYKKPVNVGLMFFNDNPEKYFSCARIEVIDKPDPTGRGMTEKIFRGPLDKQLRDALAYIKNYIIKEYVTKVPDSELAIRAFNWPYAAVEEALSNAVYHKSYQIHEPITVMVTPEKMEITSLPGPDRSISDENLERRVLVSRRYRNRRIGDYLKELDIVEGRNTGVPTILEAMRKNGSGLPSFETDDERSYFVTILPVHPVFLKGIGDHPAGNEMPAASGRRSRGEVEKMVLKALAGGRKLSTNEVAAALGYKKTTDTLRSVVDSLIKAGKLAYLYPDKPRSRNQKLCLL